MAAWLGAAPAFTNGWRCHRRFGRGRAAALVLSMADTRWGMVVVGAMLASVLQALAKSSSCVPGDLRFVPIAEGLIIKPAGAAGHQNTICGHALATGRGSSELRRVHTAGSEQEH